MRRWAWLLAVLVFIGCHRKKHYRIWGISYDDIDRMKKEKNIWDVELNPYGMSSGKICVDEWKSDQFGQVIVDPSFCQPEELHK